MPGHRVDRLHFAAKTRQGTGIDQGQGLPGAWQVLGIDQQLHVRLTAEVASRLTGGSRLSGRPAACQALRPPSRMNTVALAQPGQQPPGAGGKGTRAVVVQHHIAVIDAPLAQALDQPLRLRQRVATGHALDHRPAQVTLQVSEMRPGDMPLGIAALAVVRVFEGKTTIEDHQARRVQLLGQLLRGDQLRKGHDGLLMKGSKALVSAPGPGQRYVELVAQGVHNGARPDRDETRLQHQHLIDAALEGFFTQVRGIRGWC
jgi:hypothetical protein